MLASARRAAREAEVVPDLVVVHPGRLGQSLSLVDPAEGERGLSLGQQPNRMVPLVPDHLRGDDPLFDQPSEEAKRLGGRAGIEADAPGLRTWAALDASTAIRQYGGRLAGHAAPRHDHRSANAALGEGVARVRSSDQVAGGGNEESSLSRLYQSPLASAKAETPNVLPSYRFARTSGSRKSASCSWRTHVSSRSSRACTNPAAANSGARAESRTARSGRLPLGDGMRQGLVERLPGALDDADLVVAPRGVSNHPRPRPLGRHDDANLGLTGPAAEPVGIDERASAAMTKDHALVRESGERTAHRRATELVARAQLVLGR